MGTLVQAYNVFCVSFNRSDSVASGIHVGNRLHISTLMDSFGMNLIEFVWPKNIEFVSFCFAEQCSKFDIFVVIVLLYAV